MGELRNVYPFLEETVSLPLALSKISEHTGNKFIMIIDEWDALFREAKEDDTLQREYTMISPKKLAKYTGFTETEVKELCEAHHMDFAETKKWYDGYSFKDAESIYNPNAIIQAMKNGEFGTYWTETETYESLEVYIDMDLDGLKQAIVTMLGGDEYPIDIRTFQNDMTSIKSKDDVLTLLVHLGYLAYETSMKSVYIPNEEVRQEFIRAVKYCSSESIMTRRRRIMNA